MNADAKDGIHSVSEWEIKRKIREGLFTSSLPQQYQEGTLTITK